MADVWTICAGPAACSVCRSSVGLPLVASRADRRPASAGPPADGFSVVSRDLVHGPALSERPFRSR